MFYHIKSKSRLEFLVLSIVKLTIHMLYNKYICYLADPNLPDTFSYQLIQFHTWIKFTYDSHEFIYAFMNMNMLNFMTCEFKYEYAKFHDLWIQRWIHLFEDYCEVIVSIQGPGVPKFPSSRGPCPPCPGPGRLLSQTVTAGQFTGMTFQV